MGLEIILHGVRGSLPTPVTPKFRKENLINVLTKFKKQIDTDKDLNPKDFVESLPVYLSQGFGGNTSCVEVKSKSNHIIIDAGTGIRHLIEPMMINQQASLGKAKIHIFMTHFHWDHIMGLPFFVPLYIPGNEINFYAVQVELEDAIRSLFKRPFFPVPFEGLGAKINFHQLQPRVSLSLSDMLITPYLLDHPDPCWGYRVENEGRSYAHCVDTECLRVSAQDLGPDLPLYHKADLMLFDAQYSIQEAQEKKNWGHASATRGLELAYREKIKKVIFAHHDPMASDDKIAKIAINSNKVFANAHKDLVNHSLEWSIGKEGDHFIL